MITIIVVIIFVIIKSSKSQRHFYHVEGFVKMSYGYTKITVEIQDKVDEKVKIP